PLCCELFWEACCQSMLWTRRARACARSRYTHRDDRLWPLSGSLYPLIDTVVNDRCHKVAHEAFGVAVSTTDTEGGAQKRFGGVRLIEFRRGRIAHRAY